MRILNAGREAGGSSDCWMCEAPIRWTGLFRWVAAPKARRRGRGGSLGTEPDPAGVSATKRGFALVPRRAQDVAVLAQPVEVAHGAVLALLADGKSWSSASLALAVGASQRTVHRALDARAAAGKLQSFGRGRACRWMTRPVPGFTTTLLLPVPLPSD
jgi:hypothetical protein